MQSFRFKRDSSSINVHSNRPSVQRDDSRKESEIIRGGSLIRTIVACVSNDYLSGAIPRDLSKRHLDYDPEISRLRR